MVFRQRQEGKIGNARWLPWAEISEDRTTPLHTRICGVADFFVEFAPFRLTRLIQTPPLYVIEPTMVNTPYAPIFESPITEIRPTMRAVKVQESYSPFVVSEENEGLTKNLYRLRGTSWGNFFR
jgi:hypothetical protein